ncbi:MAG: hypothetical protein NT077_02685 [Candidatus Taylorbacteria bacterium]|nr:hypothetical protein [Candidatus Taylorbacteria bacterium]
MNSINIIQGENPLDLLKRCSGYYERPPAGPLVGYAGRDEAGKQYVGMVYVNFAMAERHGIVLKHIALETFIKFPEIARNGDGFCAAPEGGKALAVALATHLGKDYIFPEKEIIALKTEHSREKSRLIWGRHEPKPREKWWIVEDVCNNFSTTTEMIGLTENCGATVVGIICFLNRSFSHVINYTAPNGVRLPIHALVSRTIAEYSQDDPVVATDIAAGNIVWKPKNEWARLEAAMSRDRLVRLINQ